MDPPQRGGYQAPDRPGRPTDLIPYKKQLKTRFPSMEQLEDEEQRAVLLHFFANHELLAVELMALALLKFPDAPDSFRRGVFRTLQEEQNHTKWYVQRMKECGISFGDLPVSPMIWEHIADMESPLDYVSRLSLTFEQANLDYAKHYSQILTTLGDRKSAKILNIIYHDEIAHVGHGLKWLRRWKEQSQSDWDAWHKQLGLPLSPMRAKGMAPFNEEGRRKAGLDQSFIASLKRYHSSRGRSPDLWFFNPDAEIAASTPGWTSPRKLHEIAADLEPAFALAAPTQDDLVFLRRLPSDAHRDQLAQHKLSFPEVAPFDQFEAIRKARKHRSVRPWAEVTPFLSKETTLRLRKKLPDHLNPIPSRICKPQDIEAFLADHAFDYWVAKDLFSAAGRGIHRFTKGDLAHLPRRDLLVEPWLAKESEFSFLFHRYPEAEGGLRYLGISFQKTSTNGQWQGSTAPHRPVGNLPSPLARKLSTEVFPAIKEHIQPALKALLEEENYLGPICLDSFFYNETFWQPIVEVNPRWTMGRIAHQLRQKIAPTRSVTLSTSRPNRIPVNAIPLGDPSTSKLHIPILTVH
ncbi:MAG: DUF455 family protein [Akkermansiaceae bacterium]